LVFVETLPEESAYFRARYTGDRWTETQHMLALLVDHVAFMRREAQGEDSSWTPKPLPRPNDGEEQQEQQEVMNTVHDGLMAMMSGATAPAEDQ
jgi:hypothetical protein